MSDFIERPARPDIQPVDLTDHFAAAVKGYDSLKLWFRALSIDKDMEGAVLYGGALRDIYLGHPPRDYDVDAGGYCQVSAASYDPEKGRFISTEGYHTLDLKYVETPKSLQEKALEGDAPINSIAMDTDGRILAHPKFEEHATNGIYEIRDDLSESETKRAIRRFDRLHERYPDWQLRSEDPQKFWRVRFQSAVYGSDYRQKFEEFLKDISEKDYLTDAIKRPGNASQRRGPSPDRRY